LIEPTELPERRNYEPGDAEAEAAGWSAADVHRSELVGDEETDLLPDAVGEDERAPNS